MSDEDKVEKQNFVSRWLNSFQLYRSMKNWEGDDWFWFLCVLVLIFGVGCGITALFNSATADGRADYCFVKYRSGQNEPNGHYVLLAHRPWRDDTIVDSALTSSELDLSLCPTEVR